MSSTIEAVDLFCGAGGLSYGLRRGGISVRVGVDLDPTCRFPLERNNPGTRFVLEDVQRLRPKDVTGWFSPRCVRVLAGCAPCQPFSKYAVRAEVDGRWRLLDAFLRIVRGVRPEVVSMENVPNLYQSGHPALLAFMEGLDKMGYHIWLSVTDLSQFGVPQTRERLVLLAGADGHKIRLDIPTAGKHFTVRDAIGGLPAIEAGSTAGTGCDPLHISPRLSELNQARIRATPEGGSWRDWPRSLQLACHQTKEGQYYGSVYGRMAWDALAPTITTQCYGYGNGRFGHPEQNRAISLREAAILQTFPKSYQFTDSCERPTFRHVGRHIGNAVPPALGRAIASSIRRYFS
jgi:DNA (cytosine-5)-methyltransferase 1